MTSHSRFPGRKDRTSPNARRRDDAASGCPFHDAGGYMRRLPERLVVDGVRLWSAGYATGDLRRWEAAWELYAVSLGVEPARHVLSSLSAWTRAVCLWRPQGLRTFGPGCPCICRDECLCAAAVAAAQHGDGACLALAAARLGGPAGDTEVIEAAHAFGAALGDAGQRMLPVPAAVLRSLVDEPPTRSYH